MIVYVQKNAAGGLDTESRLVYQYCTMERRPARAFHYRQLLSGKLDLASCALLVGSVESVLAVLRQLDTPIPAPDYYPPALAQFLRRAVWESTLKDFRRALDGRPLFAKSREWKRITGRVFDSEDLKEFDGQPADLPLLVSEPVNWLAEFRVYVVDHQVAAVCQYGGDEASSIDLGVVYAGVDALRSADYHPAAYAFDWGLLETGETALVEVNDAWAIGAYRGIDYRTYYRFLKRRWDQMVSCGARANL